MRDDIVLFRDRVYRSLVAGLTPHGHIQKAYAHALTARAGVPPDAQADLDAALLALERVMVLMRNSEWQVTP